MSTNARPWFDAWVEAAYGPDGFWRREDPEQHFRTAAGTASLVEAVFEQLEQRPDITTVLDLGAGRGALLNGLSERVGPHRTLVGLDVRPRPAGLAAEIAWVEDLWDVRHSEWTTGAGTEVLAAPGPLLVVASEWLDDLPCPVVTRHVDGWREIVVDDQGEERPGPRLSGADLDWCDRWWPHGVRAEVGTPRDRAWSAIAHALAARGGRAVMIDYGHELTARPTRGSLAAYRDGRQVDPRPTAETNLTAHVAVDSVRAAGEELGGTTRGCCRLGEHLMARSSPSAPVDPVLDLSHRSEQAALTADHIWGSQWWLVQEW